MTGDQDHHERLRTLQEAFDRLAPEYRNVLIAVVVEGLSYEEVARKLNIPLATVRSRLARARLSLQQQLKGKAGAGGEAPVHLKANPE